MLSTIKKYIKPTLLNIGLPLVTFFALGSPISGGCSWDTPKPNLEQVVESEQLTKEQISKLVFYSAMLETVDHAKEELLDFSTNLANYQMHNPDSNRKFIYLARAHENLYDICQKITRVQNRTSGLEDERLRKLLYTSKVNQQRLFHEFGSELRKVFTYTDVVDNDFNVENYMHPKSNVHHDNLNNSLYELSRYLSDKIIR